MVLATGLAFVMLCFGGVGGLINMSYGMNAMVHNTSWVTAHFHLIFGGTVVIMYFAIAYEIWPRLTGRARALAPCCSGCSSGCGRRHDGDDPALALARAAGPVAARGAFRLRRPASSPGGGRGWSSRFVGGVMLLVERAAVHRRTCRACTPRPRRGRAGTLCAWRCIRPRVPAALNGFGLWNVLVLVLMAAAYG